MRLSFNGKIVVIVLILAGFLSCTKDNQNPSSSIIPNVPVDIVVNLNEPEFFNLTFEGGWMYYPGGSRGLLLFRSQGEYLVYDRHTPYQVEKSCAVVSVDSTNIYAKDGCTDSRFLLYDGSVANGPAELPLKMYQTSLLNDVLRITN